MLSLQYKLYLLLTKFAVHTIGYGPSFFCTDREDKVSEIIIQYLYRVSSFFSTDQEDKVSEIIIQYLYCVSEGFRNDFHS